MTSVKRPDILYVHCLESQTLAETQRLEQRDSVSRCTVTRGAWVGPPAHRSCGGRRRRRRNAHALRLDVEAERHLAVRLGLQKDPDLATPPVEGNAFDFES